MVDSIELGKYLKKIREDKKLSLREVNKLTDISFTYLNMIEHGKRNVNPTLLRNLAKAYNCDYLDLYEKAGYIDLIEDEKKKELDMKKYYMFPVYGRISAGEPNWAEECVEGRMPIDIDLMNITNPEECFFLRVNRKFNG